MEETLVIIKPDAYKAGLSGEIIKRYEDNDLKIRALKLVELDENIVCEHYKEHLGKSYYDKLIKFMLSAPCIVMVLSGENAIEKVRAINGATDPKKPLKVQLEQILRRMLLIILFMLLMVKKMQGERLNCFLNMKN